MALLSATLGNTLPKGRATKARLRHKETKHVVSALLTSDTATLAEIDEALTHAQQIPADQRGPAWHAFTDRLLEMRRHTETQRGTN